LNGSSVVIRFRQATDESFANIGWNVDDIQLDGIGSVACPFADLTIDKDASASVSAGSLLTYTIEISNDGPLAAKGVRVMDTIPANTRFVSVSVAGAGWVVTSKPSPGGTGLVIVSKSDVPAGDSATITLTVRVNRNVAVGTVITNVATIGSSISPGSTAKPTADSDPSNNTDDVETTVVAPI
jgi:uncharacterized repeat protein (TIGR01451 family)